MLNPIDEGIKQALWLRAASAAAVAHPRRQEQSGKILGLGVSAAEGGGHLLRPRTIKRIEMI